ncbi:MAG: DUF4469 domain-containing protein [Prevotellaceae bacterium]|jgi:hypothetical protein|nr:DUF4469 domain-containing protein [Prevotellaceae bacterium]
MTNIKATAHQNELTKEVTNDYYLRPQVLGTLYLPDIIRRMENKQIATLNVNGEAFVKLVFAECIAAICEGYNVVTDLFQASISIEGSILSNRLGHSIPAEEVLLRINLTQGTAAREAVSRLTVSVAEQPAPTGPIIQSVMNPTRQEPDSLNVGQMVLIQGMRLAVKGDKTEEIGVYFTKAGSEDSIRITAAELSPNSPTKLQFVLPPAVTAGEWTLRVITQGSSGGKFTKETRTAAYPNSILVA